MDILLLRLVSLTLLLALDLHSLVLSQRCIKNYPILIQSKFYFQLPMPSNAEQLSCLIFRYSDSGDENHEAKEAIVPGWAKGDELEDHLYRQKGINPDSIFDAIQPVQMSGMYSHFTRNDLACSQLLPQIEIFPANQSRLHKRTSSAVWAGTDALTQADEAIYNQQMGFAPRPRPSTFRR